MVELSKNTLSFMQETRVLLRNLEVQMGQIATKVAEIDQRSTNFLSSNTIPNPKEECKVITLISEQVASAESQVTKKPVSSVEKYPVLPKAPEYKSKMPYPQRLQKETKDRQFSKFLEVFRKLQINIPFAEVLEKIPPYVKFMKELLSKKRTLKGDETVVLIRECRAITHSKLPRKMPDLESFQIPYTIGSITFDETLCDLGVSINLMSLSVMKKLQIKEAQLTRIALQMADMSLKHVHGIIENLLVKVEKFFLLADFVILDMGDDENASIILERPFLAIESILIDVKKGEFVLRVHEEFFILKVFRSIQHSSEEDKCMKNELTNPSLQEPLNGEK
ncbi:uncharacterized protein LOC130966049 [Arachis stenosperma]|uniref:uncharacterized protein LOC130966049 n=1 Tax=Arachis stenosperma TaxID=217475 RepID=UPI0025AB9BDF|nr:uncharacterized protein LOC130966049 [Arachis stenosperma]